MVVGGGISYGYVRFRGKAKAFFYLCSSRCRYLIAINTTLSNENIHLGYLSLGISSTLVSFAKWRTFGFLLMSKPSVMLRITPTVSHGLKPSSWL